MSTFRSNRFFPEADGSVTYVTEDGDMPDAIAFEYYGRHTDNTELLFAANPGLAARGSVLPAGVVIKLPPVPKETKVKTFRRLWD